MVPVTVSAAPFLSFAASGVSRPHYGVPAGGRRRTAVTHPPSGEIRHALPRYDLPQRPDHARPPLVGRPAAPAAEAIPDDRPADPHRPRRPGPGGHRGRQLRHAGALGRGPRPSGDKTATAVTRF